MRNQATVLEAIKSSTNQPLLIDFDYTLLLANSTDEFLRSARPHWLCCLICWITDSYLRKHDPKHYNQQRDFLRMKWIMRIMPWALRRWSKHAGSFAEQHMNEPLMEAVDSKRENLVIISHGFEELIAPLLAGPMQNVPLIASSIRENRNLKDISKVQATQQYAPDLNLTHSIAVTDSPDDADLLKEVKDGYLVDWIKPQAYRFENAYLPGHYIQHCRYAGRNYLKGQLLLEDLPLIVGASFLFSSPINMLAAVLLYLSLFIIYEIGYFENDLTASRRSDDTTRPKLFELFRHYPIHWAWIWSVLAGAAGICGTTGSFSFPRLLLWVGVLLATRLCFFLHNHIAVKERYLTYPVLSSLRYGAFLTMASCSPVGLLLLGAQVLCQTANYISYRTGGSIAAYRRQSFRLLSFLLLLSISLAHQARFAPLQTSLCIAVCGYLIWRKEHRTIGEIRGWLKSLGAKPTGQRTNQSPTKPALNIGHLFQAEKDLMHRIHNFTGGRIHRVAIWGAGQNGQALARLLHRSKDIEVVCFIDDGRVGSREQNIAIRSPAAGLQDADAIFIAMNASSETIQRLAEVCDQHCKPWLHVANNCL